MKEMGFLFQSEKSYAVFFLRLTISIPMAPIPKRR